MRVLIIGSNARTGSARYATRTFTLAGVVKQALESQQHEVTLTDWWDDLSLGTGSWDRILIGLASPLAVSSDRTYQALLALHALWGDDRMSVFLDNPDVRSLKNALNSSVADPDRLWSPFLAQQKRRRFAEVTASAIRQEKIIETCHLLLNEDGRGWYPKMYLPLYPWANIPTFAKHLPNQFGRVRGLDLTSGVRKDALPLLRLPRTDSVEVADWPHWVTDAMNIDAFAATLRHPVVRILRRRDALVQRSYSQPFVVGVLEDPNNGWWTPRMAQAALAGRYYASDWRDFQNMPDPGAYTLLPSAFESLDGSERMALVARQQTTLTESTWSSQTLTEVVLEID